VVSIYGYISGGEMFDANIFGTISEIALASLATRGVLLMDSSLSDLWLEARRFYEWATSNYQRC